MIDWRTILKAANFPPQNTQNPQKGVLRGNFEDIEDTEHVLVNCSVKAGTSITWQRADSTIHSAIVDFLHAEPDGTIWTFVTLPDGWAAVNLKYVTIE